MPGLLPNVDPEGLLEYSVVYTDRAVNHMSKQFQGTMKGISATLKKVYNCETAVIVPGSGSYGMEAVARHFATGKKCLVIRNGLFSFRWSQIFDAGAIPSSCIVLKAKRQGTAADAQIAPAAIADVVAAIAAEKPAVVFAPHVETSAGIILPNDYVKQVADAAHAVGALFVLDGIASGTVWVDMKALGVDVYISAPQKGWSGPACAGLVMMNAKATDICNSSISSSFVMDLKKWLAVMQAYENGGHMYHATMPTDALIGFWKVMQETEAYGFEKVMAEQLELGAKVNALLKEKGIKVAAAEGFQAPGVIVCFTGDGGIAPKFAAAGLQIAAGVPLQVDEGEFKTFRLGLFGLDKLHNADRTVDILRKALDQVAPSNL